MATLVYQSGRWVLRTAYEERHAAKAVGARWDPNQHAWVLPQDWQADTSATSTLRRAFGGKLVVDESAQREINRRAQERKAAEERLAVLHSGLATHDGLPDGLFDYQKVGVSFLLDQQRCILADDLGLGKTIQAVVAAKHAGATRVLVIAPKSLLLQWQREIARWANVMAAIVSMHDPLPDADAGVWVVTNYEVVLARLAEFYKARFNCLIVDEATRIKNRKAKRTRAVWQLAERARWVWLLTGTPIRNRPAEIWALLHALSPREFRSYWKFVEEYCYVWRSPWGTQVGDLRPDRLSKFHQTLLPYLLRRDRTLLKLPPLSHEVVLLKLDPQAERAYRNMEAHLVTSTQHGFLVAPNTVAQLTRLRQIATDPKLVGVQGDSCKTEWIREWLEDHAEERKSVIYCEFRSYVESLANTIASYNPVLVTGEQTAFERDEAVRRLNEDPSCRVLLCTSAAAEGLNLQLAADTVIFTNKPWTPDQVDQVIGRVYRQGQSRPVHVFSLVAAGTVDEHLEEVLREKRGIADRALSMQAVIEAILAKANATEPPARLAGIGRR